MTKYRKLFDPPLVPQPHPQEHVADRAGFDVYVYDEKLVLAVNVALATKRPLLLRGRPGTGKSSLARNVARHLRRRFYSATISSRTQARDLLWTVDDVARLSDATGDGHAKKREHYVIPGVLWWAFSPETAALRGLDPATVPDDHRLADIAEYPGGTPRKDEAAVVLLDEVDKADPDVPNDLLEPLGLFWFRSLREQVVQAGAVPLVILTTNEERELPRAFLRRCVVHVLPQPTRVRLRQIAEVRFGAADLPLYKELIRAFPPAPAVAADDATEERVDVSVAEFLDAVAAARKLNLRPGHPLWQDVLDATTSKPPTLDLR